VTIPQIITWALGNIEFVIIGLVLLSTVFNFIGSIGKATREAQRRAELEVERARTSAEMQRRQLEANPNTQSYEGYLQRTEQPDTTFNRPQQPPASSGAELKDLQAEILEALGMGTQTRTPPPVINDPQADLRRKLAEKMGRTQTPPTPPRPTPRPTPRPAPRVQRPQSDFEVYLESTQSDTLQRDSRPDSLGHSARQPHFDSPRSDPRNEGSEAYKGEGGVAVIQRPDAVNEVQGIGKERLATTSFTSGLTNPRNVAQGIIWAEILGKPRSRR
jgi:type II secretory pathway pseudopilin PulG